MNKKNDKAEKNNDKLEAKKVEIKKTSSFKKKKKAMGGGLNAAIEKVKQETMTAKEGKVVRMTKRKSKNKNIARGCGAIMSARRKKTKYS